MAHLLSRSLCTLSIAHAPACIHFCWSKRTAGLAYIPCCPLLLLMIALPLPARQPTGLLLQEQQVKNSLVPGFVRATGSVVTTYFPPPRLPPGYVPVHRPSRDAEAVLPAGGV